MLFRRLGAFAFASMCVAGVAPFATSEASAQTIYPFPGGGTLACTGSSCAVVGGLYGGATGSYSSTTGLFTGSFGHCTVTGSLVTYQFSASPGCASFGASNTSVVRSTQEVSQAGVGAVNTVATGIRDTLQGQRNSSPVAMRYSWEDGDDEAMNYTAQAKGVGKSPVFKAMPKTPMERTLRYAVWGQGFGEIEWRRETFLGADAGRRTETVGAIGGADVTITRLFSANDAYVIGVLGGYTSARVRNNDGSSASVEGPGVGYYTVYVNGGFSTDTVFKVDFFDLNRSVVGLADLGLGLTNYTSAFNVNYKFNTTPWWIEPTVGASYTKTVWNTASKLFGFQDGHVWRLQAGVRAGTSYDWGTVRVEPTLTAMVYSDVEIRGGSVASAVAVAAAPVDEGKIFVQGIGKLNFLWTDVFSSYIEAEVRGREGVTAVAGRAGLRYAF